MFLRILLTAIFNLALGYGLAWYIHGPRGLFTRSLPRWLPLGKKPASEATDPLSHSAAASTAATSPSSNPTIAITAAMSYAASEPASKLTPTVESSTPLTPAAPAAAEDNAQATSNEDVAKSAAAAADSQHGEILKAVTDLHGDVSNYRASLAKFDDRLHECIAGPDAERVRECVENFRRLNELHLQVVGPRILQIERAAETAGADGVASELAEAIERQISGIELAQAELARLGPEVDCLLECQQLLDETRQLAVTSDQLEATIEQTVSEINRIHAAFEPMPIARSTLGQLQSHSLNLDKAAL